MLAAFIDVARVGLPVMALLIAGESMGVPLPGETALMVPHTDDGRVLFAIPWLGRVLVGTTDTPVPEVAEEPRPLAEEADFLLRHAARRGAHPAFQWGDLSHAEAMRSLQLYASEVMPAP